jgi:KaiC/GvpD/RAD55 family RecA-like ATPase
MKVDGFKRVGPPPVSGLTRFQHLRVGKIIDLKERSFIMLKKDLILRNPLRLLGQENKEILPQGGFGAVLARAGVGKTALMVQLSLETLLRGKNVLHVSLDDPVNKVSLWYDQVFNHLARQYNLQQINDLWDSMLPHRFIMTFKVEGFSVPKLEERLTDLIEQNIFSPDMIIIDGLPFTDTVDQPLKQLKAFSEKHRRCIWFSVRTHRHEETGPGGIPPQLTGRDDLFDIIIQLQPQGEEIHVRAIKGDIPETESHVLKLDPETMLIHKK